MPYRNLPASDAQRLAALNGALTKWNGTAAADRLLTAAHFASLDLTDPNSLHSVFKRDFGEAGAALSGQAHVSEDAITALAALVQVCSHFIQVFNFAVARGIFPRSDRAYYGLDVSHSDVPVMASYADADQWAARLIDGEAARLAAAPAPDMPATAMSMPGAGEVAAARQALAEIRSRQSTAKDSYDKEQSDVETDRPAIDTFIADVWDTVEFRLRTLDGPSRRRRAREWGVAYVTRPGEPPDPPPTPEPPAQ